MRPPILTKREFEIIEFLAVGATRDEIAAHFKISPETVKLHSKNIYDKFGIANYRDGAAQIQAFINAYGQNGLGYQVYHTRVDVEITVNSARTRSEWRISSTGYVVRGQLSELTVAFFDQSHISNVILNGQNPVFHQPSPHLLNYSINLSPSLTQGDPVDRTTLFTETAPEGQKLADISYSSGTPAENLTIQLNVLGQLYQPLKATVLKGMKHLDATELTGVKFQQSGNSATLFVPNPAMDQLFVIA